MNLGTNSTIVVKVMPAVIPRLRYQVSQAGSERNKRASEEQARASERYPVIRCTASIWLTSSCRMMMTAQEASVSRQAKRNKSRARTDAGEQQDVVDAEEDVLGLVELVVDVAHLVRHVSACRQEVSKLK